MACGCVREMPFSPPGENGILSPVLGGWLGGSDVREKADDRLDAAVEVGEVELLVGGVKIVVRQTEAHQDGGALQLADEVADDGDGAAAADEDRLLAEDLVHGLGGGADKGVVGADHDGV